MVIRQILRFGVVGSLAALVNFAIVLALVEDYAWHPLWANVVAFLTAYQVSFFGHRYWTFKEQSIPRLAFGRFFLVAVISFLLNEGLFAVFLHGAKLYYPIALLLTLILIPPLTFLLSKWWAFN